MIGMIVNSFLVAAGLSIRVSLPAYAVSTAFVSMCLTSLHVQWVRGVAGIVTHEYGSRLGACGTQACGTLKHAFSRLHGLHQLSRHQDEVYTWFERNVEV